MSEYLFKEVAVLWVFGLGIGILITTFFVMRTKNAEAQLNEERAELTRRGLHGERLRNVRGFFARRKALRKARKYIVEIENQRDVVTASIAHYRSSLGFALASGFLTLLLLLLPFILGVGI